MNVNTYTIIVPAFDRTGPVNVAFDLGRAAAAQGWDVRLLSLSPGRQRQDMEFATECRQWRMSDLWRLRGIVHTHCLRPDLLGGLLALNRRCVLVTTLHNFFLIDLGFNYPRPLVWVAWQFWRRALKRYTHVVCISEAMRRYYRRLLPGQHLALARNFRAEPSMAGTVPPETQQWLTVQRAAQRRQLVYVGSLSTRKNIFSLLDALHHRPDLALLVCGEGPIRQELERRVASLDLSDRVRFAGQILNPSTVIAASDVLVLPSLAEGFPLVVLEAAAVGVPSLLSNIAVHRELSRLGFGTTFQHRNGNDFGQSIDEILRKFPAPSAQLHALWLAEYSPGPGFSRYETLFTS